jgi:4-alpha-glucanotransferase
MEQALPQFIRFGREVCNDLDQAERREWWLSNGLGGYAAGTVAGTLTRRYHGLLFAPMRPPLGRTLVFAKTEAALIVGDRIFPLHSNRWQGGVIEPRRFLDIESFHLDGRLPVWRYAIGDLRLEARIWMQAGANTTCLAWRLLSEHEEARRPRLTVRLLVNARDHHGQTEAGAFTPDVELGKDALHVTLTPDLALHFRSRCGRFQTQNQWIERFDLQAERARGLPDQDNHLCIGVLELPLHAGEWVGFTASMQADAAPYLGESLRQRQHLDASLLRQAKVQSPALATAPGWIDQLLLAADSFLVRRALPDSTDDGVSVIAGYPWFGDWGRDSFIALPGLTLPAHRHDDARRLLESWAGFVQDGLLPNHFPEDGAPAEYNAADAPLWYIEAWRAYLEASGDLVALARHFPVLTRIIDHYANGTRYGIGVDPADGLLRAGVDDVAGEDAKQATQLTWMDARVDGWPVTARIGKPVELNALWYNALMSLAEFSRRLRRDEAAFAHLAAQTRQGFRRFIRADGEGLFDVLDGEDKNQAGQVRPNQIFAVSLTHSPLSQSEQAAVVRTVGDRLLTSYGLRTLDPADADYRARYAGGVRERDATYHQGPAWAWLLPHYALALHRAGGDAAEAQALMQPLADHLADAGLGSISELFDAEPPHTPRGAPSQAWSVACALQAWCLLERAKGKNHA